MCRVGSNGAPLLGGRERCFSCAYLLRYFLSKDMSHSLGTKESLQHESVRQSRKRIEYVSDHQLIDSLVIFLAN